MVYGIIWLACSSTGRICVGFLMFVTRVRTSALRAIRQMKHTYSTYLHTWTFEHKKRLCIETTYDTSLSSCNFHIYAFHQTDTIICLNDSSAPDSP